MTRGAKLAILLLVAGAAVAVSASARGGQPLRPGPVNVVSRQDPEAAVRLFADAERLAGEGDLEGALRNYELLVQQFPAAALADDALLRVASGRWQLRDRAVAEAAIAVLKADYPRTAGAAGAFVLEGDIRMATSATAADLQAAREAYRSVVLLYGRADFPVLEWRAPALLGAGEASMKLGESEAAAAHFVAAIEDEPHTGFADAARVQLATLLMRGGEWQAAADILQRVVDESERASSGHAVDSMVSSGARRRLQLIYRLQLRSSLSQSPWEGARQLRFTGPQLENPEGIGAAGERVVIVDPGIPLIAVVEPDGTLSDRVPSSEASRPWWGLSGQPYIATGRSVLNLATRERQDFLVPDGSEMKPVEGIIAAAHGLHRQWFVLDGNRRQVLMYDDAAGFRSMLMGNDDSEPVDLAVDHLGRPYVLDRRNDAVLRFDAEGGERTRVLQREWRRPEALAIDDLGNLYVLDRDAATIEVFDTAGQLLWQLGPQLPGGLQLRSPRDISVDGAGRIFVADRDLKAFLVIE